MQAVVLAAGKGRRLWPLTKNRPKPMIPVADRPILDHVLDALGDAGVDEVILVVGANRDRVQTYFEDGGDRDFEITYVLQEEQLGTGHALLQAEPAVDGPFVALNGDRIISTPLVERVWTRHRETDSPVMSVTRVDEPSRYGVVTFQGGRVAGIDEQPVPELTTTDCINAGVYAFPPAIFDAVRRTDTHGEQALTDTLTNLIAEERVQAVRYSGRWLDVSEPWDLLTVNHSLVTQTEAALSGSGNVAESAVVAESTVVGSDVTIHPQAVVRRSVTLGDNVQIGSAAVVENSVVLPDATVGPGAVVRDAVVGANSTVGPNTTIEGGTTTVTLHETVYEDVTLGALLGDNVTVGGNATVRPGTVVGNNAVLDTGALVSGRIDDATHVRRG